MRMDYLLHFLKNNTMLETILSIFVYIAINVVDAYTDRRIAVNHIRGAIVYGVICAVIAWPLLQWTDARLLDVILLPLLTRAAIFDPVFYLMKGKYRGIFFEEVKKIGGEKSIIDNLERKLGLSVFWMRVIYFVLYIAYLIFIYAN